MKNITNNTMHTFYNLSTDLYTHSCKKNLWMILVAFLKNRSSNYHKKNT